MLGTIFVMNRVPVRLSDDVEKVIREAKALAKDSKPDARHLLLALIRQFPQAFTAILPEELIRDLEQQVQAEIETDDRNYALPLELVVIRALELAHETSQNSIEIDHLVNALLDLREQRSQGQEPSQQPNFSPLKFGIDLTHLARSGELPTVVGRDNEIDTLIEVLSRPINPYAVLVGLEGVGRRAVVQGVAERIVAGKVPPHLANRPVILLSQIIDHPDFYLALVQEASERQAILYLEPFETFLLTAPAPQLEAIRVNFLSALVSQRVPVIGAVSSINQFRQQIGRAPDLLKRFQPIMVHPLTAKETLIVLQQLAALFQKQFNLVFENETLELIVQVADEHIQHSPFPDKAIQLMDHVAGRARTQGKVLVEPSLVWEVASAVTGLPIGQGEQTMATRLRELEPFLKSRVIGQDDAIETLVRVFSLKIRRLDLRPERPNGVFLFVGPTGVGKTETARALAEFFFGSSERMLRLDMNQFYERHTVARLLGAEFGYVGFERGSPLLDFVAENPFSVVLLDEIEKAHEDVHKFFLQVFDDGAVTDAQGRRVSFADTIIIMTSNLQPEKTMGFLHERDVLGTWRQAFAQYFSPEFINRVDAICVFQPLQKEHIKAIIEQRFLPRIQAIFHQRKMELQVDDSAIEWLAQMGYNQRYGARELERTIERELLLLLAPYVPLMIETIGKAKQTVHVFLADGRLAVEVKTS